MKQLKNNNYNFDITELSKEQLLEALDWIIGVAQGTDDDGELDSIIYNALLTAKENSWGKPIKY